jgi:hypothetical protein
VAERLQRSRSWVNEAIGRACALRLLTKERRRRDNGGETTCFYRIALKAPFPDNVAGKPRHEQPVADQARPAPVKARAARHHVSKPAVQDVPADWRPSPEDLTWAASRYPAADLDRHTERFVHRCRAKGYRFAEIGAAWREWLAEAQTKEPENRERAARNAATQKNRLSVWAAVARGGAPAV